VLPDSQGKRQVEGERDWARALKGGGRLRLRRGSDKGHEVVIGHQDLRMAERSNVIYEPGREHRLAHLIENLRSTQPGDADPVGRGRASLSVPEDRGTIVSECQWCKLWRGRTR